MRRVARRRLIRILLIVCLTTAIYYIGLQTPETTQPSLTTQKPQPGFYAVLEVADGDTFTVNMDGSRETIRLIGVDTPETHRPNTPVQCFGQAASTYTENLLDNLGNQVRLEADPLSTNRDRYNRLLRYAYLPDGRLLNHTIIEEGYGFAYVSFLFTKSDLFETAEKQAREKNRGLWAGCETTETKSGIKQTVPQ